MRTSATYFTLASGTDIFPANIKRGENIKSEMANYGKIIRAIILVDSAIILLERNIQNMVKGSLNSLFASANLALCIRAGRSAAFIGA